MLSDFKDNEFYQYASNLKQFYHAYLFEVDDIDEFFPLIMAFSKMIICKNHFVNNLKCNGCNICNLIDNNAFSNFKVIEPNGINIKKEQIKELESAFSLKSANDTNQVYIIKEAEKMNSSAMNSMLKFIEEPYSGVYGILVTTNKKAILDTILSRCILISLKLKKNIKNNTEDFIHLSEFLKLIITKKEDSIPYIKSKFLIFYETRCDIINAMSQMEIIIDYCIMKYFNINSNLDSELCNIIDEYLNNISLKELVNILDNLVKYKNKILMVSNINVNLFMDQFIISISQILK